VGWMCHIGLDTGPGGCATVAGLEPAPSGLEDGDGHQHRFPSNPVSAAVGHLPTFISWFSREELYVIAPFRHGLGWYIKASA
jgi:hypothetical protein